MSYFITLIICCLIYLFLLSISLDDKNKKESNISASKTFLIFLPFFLFTAFRDPSIGVDTQRYYYEFIVTGFNGRVRSTESFFSYILILFNSFDANFSQFIFFQAFFYYISLSFLTKIIPRKSHAVYVLSIASFFLFSFGLSGIRQSIAISFLSIAILFLYKRRYLAYLLLGFIAFRFHNSSAIPFVLLYLIHSVNLSNRYFFLALLSAPVFSFIEPSFLIGYFQGTNIKQISNFDTDSKELLSTKVAFFAWLYTVLVSLLLLYGERIRLISWPLKTNKTFHAKSIVLFGTVFMNSFLWLSTSVRLMDRVAFYFVPLFALFCAWVLGSSKKSNKEFFVFITIVSFLLILFSVLNVKL